MNKDITVLVVEDETYMRTLLDDGLSRDRFTVKTADRVVGALSLMEKADIIVLDLGLPNGDGRTLLNHWNRGSQPRPSIIITGGSLTKKEEDKLLQDAWNILKKPFSMALVTMVVERYASCVRGFRAFAEIEALRRRIMLLTIVVAALGGYEILLPLIKSVL